MDGWIKLYRKVKQSEIWHDQTAFRVFVWILLTINHKTGKLKLGRKWASKECGLKETTFYSALKRLEKKFKIVNLMTTKMTIKYTEVTVQNWRKYQSNDNLNDNQMTINQQSNDNQMTHNKKKEEKKEEESTKKLYKKKDYLRKIPLKDINEFKKELGVTEKQIKDKADDLLNYCEAHGKKYKNYRAFLKNALKRDFTKKEDESIFEGWKEH